MNTSRRRFLGLLGATALAPAVRPLPVLPELLRDLAPAVVETATIDLAPPGNTILSIELVVREALRILERELVLNGATLAPPHWSAPAPVLPDPMGPVLRIRRPAAFTVIDSASLSFADDELVLQPTVWARHAGKSAYRRFLELHLQTIGEPDA